MPLVLDKETFKKYDVIGPRYTSYPTAPEWSASVKEDVCAQMLRQFGAGDKTLSLYVHIPFCEQLCYFCACHKVIHRQKNRVGDQFLTHLFREIELVAGHIGKRKVVRQFHWGGGTPTYLNGKQIAQLYKKVAQHFEIDPHAEISIEVDPRTVPYEKLKILRELGFNRISLGVQDFDLKVQKAINRIQPYEKVLEVYKWCRDLGFPSVNFDLVYGLPHQTCATFHDTMQKVLWMRPDRVALYSFAYVPWVAKTQNKFKKNEFVASEEKLNIFIQARNDFLANGYQAVAMDHFALKTDEMAQAFDAGRLYRNFMGYTLKPADEFIGLGPSSIGFFEHTFVQNVKTLPEYYAALKAGQLAVERGKVLSADDRIRQAVIRDLMCLFQVDKQAFKTQFNQEFDLYFTDEAQHIRDCIEDGLLTVDATHLRVTDLGRIFIRNIAMGFDWYLRQKNGHKRFSSTV